MMRLAACYLLLHSVAVGAELAVLANGFSLRVDRHEQQGAEYVLYSAQGITRLPVREVLEFEAIPTPITAPALVPVVPVKAETKPPATPTQLVERAAEKHGLPPEFVKLVARAESALNPRAVSPKGAIGLMQLMPETAAALKVDPHDAEQNAEAGARLLKELLLQYQNQPDQLRRALAAYNAGPGAVARYNGVPPYRETQLYVDKIVGQYKRTLQ
ncbi:MAG: lytic transglycosylase domain-containing protein [Bryobacteraceae bacterium]|nr:lytic transglycosylase domain-containing protein [Bryobacteraceae bacterium]